MRVSQEFHCTVSGEGCGGYITVKLNTAINGIVKVVCPKCGHEHTRNIVKGLIRDDGRHSGSPSQEILPTMAAYSVKPRTESFIKGVGNIRDGVEITPAQVQAGLLLRESLVDRFASRLTGGGK